MEESKGGDQNIKTFFKKRNIITYFIIGIVIFGWGYFYGLPIIKQKIGQWKVGNLAEALKKAEEEDYKLALADTYGGKTPQETLDMFIDAVEKGDYELASKYFVIPKQEEWGDNLKAAKNIEEFLKDTKKIKENIDSGRYSDEKDWFLIEKPIYTKFIRYPGGNWKIIEI